MAEFKPIFIDPRAVLCYNHVDFTAEDCLMIPYWFERPLPPSRHAIENAVRLGMWGAGYGGIYCSCTQDRSPYRCECLWNGQPFSMEWVPMDYLILRMKEPNEDLLRAFESTLGHKALAAYRDSNKDVVVEWRVRGLQERLKELEAAGVADLEKLY